MGFARESNGFGGKSTLFASWTGPLIRRGLNFPLDNPGVTTLFSSGFTPTTRVVEDKSKVSYALRASRRSSVGLRVSPRPQPWWAPIFILKESIRIWL
jgi:hypothetical protein